MLEAPRTAADAGQFARVVHSPAHLPQLLADHIGLWHTTATPTTITQQHVDPFTGSIGDPNPIHRADSSHPIVPGMMTVSSLPRFLEECVPIFGYGFGVMFEHVEADFNDFVFVGESVNTGYFVHEPQVKGRKALVVCEFTVQVVGVNYPAAKGKVNIRFIERQLFEQMVARAARRLPSASQ